MSYLYCNIKGGIVYIPKLSEVLTVLLVLTLLVDAAGFEPALPRLGWIRKDL